MNNKKLNTEKARGGESNESKNNHIVLYNRSLYG